MVEVLRREVGERNRGMGRSEYVVVWGRELGKLTGGEVR